MKILIALQNFDYLSGSPMYSYELSKQLVENGHDVSILSKIGGEITERATKNGVKCYSFDNPPEDNFDILHLNQFAPAEFALKKYKDIPAIMTIHSEWDYELPYRDERIKKYICIRPSIQERLKNEFGIENTTIIYNGIDFNRFNSNPMNLPDYVEKAVTETRNDIILFVGTIDHLRKQAGLDLIEKANTQGFEVIFVGDKFDTWLDDKIGENVSWAPSMWNIEHLTKLCTKTAGIMLGRTTIEGWACDKPGIIYDIDLQGNIKSCKTYSPPLDIEKYDIINVAKQIEDEYNAILSK